MELLLKNGDYVPDGKGGFCAVQGAEEMLGRVLFLLMARRGSFPLLPEVGSFLYLLPREKPSRWESLAGQYVQQALAGEHELTLRGVTVSRRPDGGGDVLVKLDWKGEALEMTVGVNA